MLTSQEDTKRATQQQILEFIHVWVRTEKTPVPKKEIVAHISKVSTVKPKTINNALDILRTKGYIRGMYSDETKCVVYAQLRTL